MGYIIRSNGQDVTGSIGINGNTLIFPSNDTGEDIIYSVMYSEYNLVTSAYTSASTGSITVKKCVNDLCKLSCSLPNHHMSGCLRSGETAVIYVSSYDNDGSSLEPDCSVPSSSIYFNCPIIEIIGIDEEVVSNNSFGPSMSLGNWGFSFKCVRSWDGLVPTSCNGCEEWDFNVVDGYVDIPIRFTNSCSNEVLTVWVRICKEVDGPLPPEPPTVKSIHLCGTVYGRGESYPIGAVNTNYYRYYSAKLVSDFAIPEGISISCNISVRTNAFGESAIVEDGSSSPCHTNCPNQMDVTNLTLGAGEVESIPNDFASNSDGSVCGCRYWADYNHYLGAFSMISINGVNYSTNVNANRLLTTITLNNVTYKIYAVDTPPLPRE